MISSRRIVLVGATGMLGSAFRSAIGQNDLVCLSHGELDIRQPGAIRTRVAELHPNILLNCAADTDVEGAEAAPSRAFEANALLPDLLAQACRDVGTKLVQFSSTGCYGDHKQGPYDDYDALRPTTVHHRAKAAGEAAVREAGCDHLILRLGWLFGGAPGQRKNFVWARIVEARAKPEIASDPHQTGNPTHVDDVVKQTFRLLDAELSGTFNCVATGAVTRFDYVAHIVALAGLPTRLIPRRFERRAPVSPNEAATNIKLDLLNLNVMPSWKDSLGQYVRSMLSGDERS
jgi:dTDP-4-dehydrorhamnose reductase